MRELEERWGGGGGVEGGGGSIGPPTLDSRQVTGHLIGP